MKRSQIALLWTDSRHQSTSICDFLKIFVSHREYRRASIQRHRSHIWGPKLMVRVVPDLEFSQLDISHFQRGIGRYTWLACKTDISEEVRSHQSNVISRLFVFPGPPTGLFRTTNSIAFKLDPINETVTNRAAWNWFRAPKRFNLWLSENFCLSQRMQESIDPKA